MSKSFFIAGGTAFLLVMLVPSPSRTDVISHGGTTITMDFVTVAAPGGVANSGDVQPQGTFGSVGYDYRIGKYEVTAGQYCAFLNAVDPTGANPNGIYTSNMTWVGGCKITWNSELSIYDFSSRPSGDESDWKNRPVDFVTWYDAARFANWVTTGNTETGVYALSGPITVDSIMDHQLAATSYGAACFLPTENEWYKAAYYGGAGSSYYDYPTGSDSTPGYITDAGNLSGTGDPFVQGGTDPGNYATYNGDGGTTGIGPDYYKTDVGEHENSPSPYGTFDQGGNITEWNEVLIGDRRGTRAGVYATVVDHLHAETRLSTDPWLHSGYMGFRVSVIGMIPEPCSLALLLLGMAAMLTRRNRVRR